ncbi:alpha-N-acetylglucosaminidase [Cristinia sonorae]|uniref:Alpha-N-acetylglucosaminidase n=1 Tax=Cristinia sonorae TaxID=1940300 RepID=A0A8K0XNH1_9AGAR|nr:alpha-N-acetylglucosaminidase [Cristinia sonorae]
MRAILVALTAVSAALAATTSLKPAPVSPLQGVQALVKRRIPKHANDFTFQLVNGTGDSFLVSDTKGHSGGVTVQCTTVSACSRGLYTYLTQIGGVDIWWTGSRLDQLPSRLPAVGKPINGSSIVPWRYHFNTVTFSYTTAFWGFDKWELLLDWLALRGVNLPLAWVGNEYILIQVFKEAGLSDAEISDFLSGPAFQAWNRFGNIQGSWGGALPVQWVEDQFALQKQIVKRMVDLGMTPVLPSFTGFVPKALQSHYPNASIVIGSQWSGFPTSLTNDSFLNPFDPLFTKLQTSFISKQAKAYGNISHIYTLDQYNENDPASGDLDYLRNVTAGTYASLRAADPQAVWLMQGWLFFSSEDFWTNERVEAYLSGVPAENMIVLDLYTESQPQWNRTNNYFGKNWVWCELHDYGGNQGFEGNLEVLTQGPIAALTSPNSTMKGIGLTMEGQEGNEIVYDILLDQAWSSTPLNVSTYVKNWVSRRYNVKSLPAAATQAWSTLASTVYNNTNTGSEATIKSILELTPATSGLVNRTGHHPTLIPYDTDTSIVPAFQLLLNASSQNPALRTNPEFLNDIVDISRQLLANRFIDAYLSLIATWNSTTTTARSLTLAGETLLDILGDLDAVLATNPNFLVSTWIHDARQWASTTTGSGSNTANVKVNQTYAAYLEYNARNQLTLWGPNGEINDYASKQWAGLVGQYYAERWATFVRYLADARKSTGDNSAYNATEIKARLLGLGKEWDTRIWGNKTRGETWGTTGDALTLAQGVFDTWA